MLCATLQDFKTNTGHGKLLVDDSLYPVAYATNVNEQARMRSMLHHPSEPLQANWSAGLPSLYPDEAFQMDERLPCLAQVIEQINLATQARTNSYNYSSFLPDPTVCTGTHSIGYSNISRQCALFQPAVLICRWRDTMSASV